MSPAEFQEAASPSPSSFGFSIFSRRRDQVHSMEANCPDVEAFQKQIAERFHSLAAAESDDLLSIPWIRKLLDTFLCCQEEFRAIVFGNRSSMNRPPMDKHITDFFDRSVKALDVCNAIRDGIEQIRQWQKHLEIVICALDNQRGIGEGQFRRAKKALSDLCIAMLDEKESQSALGHRNWSFGRQNVPKEPPPRSFSQFRSLSWSVSRSWSAARQLQAINSNLAVPKANEVAATHGLSMAVFTMNYVLLFVMWALVAAIPCQDRGLQTQFSVTRQLIWGAPILSLHEKILEESKKRERKNACGLLKEIYDVEKCARNMSELADSMQFPLTEDKEKEVKDMVKEVGMVNEALKDGLDPLERRVREVFHRIVQCRNEGLDSMRS